MDSLLYGGLLGLFGLDPFNNGPVYPGALVFGACCCGNLLSKGLVLEGEGFFGLGLMGRVMDGRLGVDSIDGFLLLDPAQQKECLFILLLCILLKMRFYSVLANELSNGTSYRLLYSIKSYCYTNVRNYVY